MRMRTCAICLSVLGFFLITLGLSSSIHLLSHCLPLLYFQHILYSMTSQPYSNPALVGRAGVILIASLHRWKLKLVMFGLCTQETVLCENLIDGAKCQVLCFYRQFFFSSLENNGFYEQPVFSFFKGFFLVDVFLIVDTLTLFHLLWFILFFLLLLKQHFAMRRSKSCVQSFKCFQSDFRNITSCL